MARRQRGFLQAMLYENWKNKGIALFLAVVVWGIAYGSTLQEKTVEVEVELVPASTDEVVLSAVVLPTGTEFDDTVKVTVRGQRRRVDEIERSYPGYRGRFEVREGRVDLKRTEAFSFGPGVEVVGVEPRLLDVDTDRKVIVPVKVGLDTTGTVPREYTFSRGETAIIPETVRVVMPESYENRVQVVTEPLDLATLTPRDQRITLSVYLRVDRELDAEHVAFALDAPREAQVAPNLGDARKEKTLTVPILFAIDTEFPVAITEDENKVDITCQGTDEQLAEWERRVELGESYLLIPVRVYGELPIQFVSGGKYIFAGLPAGVEPVDYGKTALNYKVSNPTEE